MNGQAAPSAALDAALKHLEMGGGDDAVQCLRHLLKAEMRDGSSMGSVVERAWRDRSLWRRLGDCGVMMKVDCIAIDFEHWFLSGVFVDSQWCLDYGEALLDLDGAVLRVQTVKHNKKLKRVEISREVIERFWLG